MDLSIRPTRIHEEQSWLEARSQEVAVVSETGKECCCAPDDPTWGRGGGIWAGSCGAGADGLAGGRAC